jgi:hypothetical protein
MKETWKTIEKCPLYEVSTLGRVRNRRTLRILAQQIQGSGNAIVCMSNRGKIKTYSVNRLVLEAFKPAPNMDSLNIKYLNGIKSDNNIENLDWTLERMAYTLKPNELKELKNTINKYIDKILDEWYYKYFRDDAKGISSEE